MDRRAFARSFASLSLASTALSNASAEAPHSATTSAKGFGHPSTFTHVGKEERPFAAAPEGGLADQEGHGYLDHMWFGGDFANYTRVRLRIYVDHEPTASIDMELGLGVGVGFADPSAPWGTKFGGITGGPSGIFCNYRIPFYRHIRVTAQLPAGVPTDIVFWWIVRGVQGLSLNISGLKLPDNARLYLYKNLDLTTQPLQIFDLCKVSGAGMVFQVTMTAKSTNFEYMEGQMRAYLGSDQQLQFLSSGLEDYFLGTYYFNRGLYHLPQGGICSSTRAMRRLRCRNRHRSHSPALHRGGCTMDE